MKKRTINNALEALCAIILFGVILIIISFYNKIPTMIPIHYDLYSNGIGLQSLPKRVEGTICKYGQANGAAQNCQSKRNNPARTHENRTDGLVDIR